MISERSQLLEALEKDDWPSDERFDGLLETQWQRHSRVHWSSLAVCRAAIRLLRPTAGERVLDVGSGAGKLCVTGALLSPATFVGVEQRPRLVEQARQVARRLDAALVSFIEADAFDVDWRRFECLYFFNPFGELRFPKERMLDDQVSRDLDKYQQCVTLVAAKLRELPLGTRVAIYNGLGCIMPSSYVLLASEPVDDSKLELWRNVGQFPMSRAATPA